MSGADDEADWIEVRRSNDSLEPAMVADFLRDHGVRVALHGNAHAPRLLWSATSDVVRVAVHPADLVQARAALEAMDAGGVAEQPFRGKAIAPAGDDAEPRFEKPRSALAAACLAVIVPIGAGHFYARHGAAGAILCAGIVGALLGSMLGHGELLRAAVVLVAVDVALSSLAVRRFNEGRVPAEATQRSWALAAVGAAFVLAWVSAGS